MLNVLSIDTSVSPAQAIVVGVEENSIRVLEHHTIDLPETEWREQLKSVLNSIRTQWQNLVLFFSPKDVLSLNLSLPFKDTKSIEKIIDMEVQDVVPFELSDFILHHRHIRPLPEKGEDIHAALVANDRIAQMLSDTRACEVEPYIISTPGSALQGIYHLTGTSIADNSFIVLERTDKVVFAAFIDKKIVYERTIESSFYTGDNVEEHLRSQILLSCAFIEKRYEVSIDDLYLIKEVEKSNLEELDGRKVSTILLHDFVPLVPQQVSAVALFGAIFGQDYPAPTILSNFRTREFAYSPRLNELAKALKALSPYIGMLVVTFLIGVGILYGARAYALSKGRQALLAEIHSKIPEFSAEPGAEAMTLQGKASELENSQSTLTTSPLEILTILSEDLPTIPQIDLQKISIRNGKIRLEGSTPNYSTQEKLETLLNRKTKIFCGKIDNLSTSTGSRDNVREFQLEIKLCR